MVNLSLTQAVSQLAESDIDMMIGASADSVMMVEGEMDEISEEEMADAIKFAHEAIKVQCAAQVTFSRSIRQKRSARVRQQKRR